MSSNPDNQMRRRAFLDRDHPIMGQYYDLLEDEPNAAQLKKALWRLIEQDPTFFDPYLTLAEILMEEGKQQQAYALVREAYERATQLITDKKGNWPERMEWSWLENRHVMRVISQYAYVLWEEGKTDEALGLFRKLLKMNPHDNQGARFAILALRLGLRPGWEDEFLVDHGPMAGQATDATKTDSWFRRNAKRFPKEFKRYGWIWRGVNDLDIAA